MFDVEGERLMSQGGAQVSGWATVWIEHGGQGRSGGR